MEKDNIVLELNMKTVLVIIIILILILFCFLNIKLFITMIIANNNLTKNAMEIYEANIEPQFEISKIIKYSSAESIDNSIEQNLQDISISQYSDFAIYINNIDEELSEKNIIKELYIDNFNIDVNYKNEEPVLYYKNPLEISKFRMNEENKINDRLTYKIVHTNEENQNSDYNDPTFYADCSNPITIEYVNKNIVQNYKVNKNKGLVSYDGRIFNNLDIDLKSLEPKISFTIHLKNGLDKMFSCNVILKLDFENDNESIKSGYFIQIFDNIEKYKFIQEV